ncbi:hypothetical protein FVEG_13365 [Fusarium verticillioides 7600]|uniref:Uncharacterized protein n=1 Tax=Gibberella moniliformis (strain M3125 / FGSC 7600) TaxID=334819 RepID=W7N5F7_GIBM7|nr:hypothetical protein FVEG_13365 [Fusarium verticillioides 7600]EWG55355.1 hypothetical protein FVEG_13365 [Fusarium verticillioides 7600]
MDTNLEDVQSRVFWDVVRLHLINDTGFNLVPSKQDLPHFLACTFKKQPDTILPGRRSYFEISISGDREGGKEPSSLFFIFLIGDTGKKLAVWVWMHPRQCAAEVKATVVDNVDGFGMDLLEKLSQDVVTADEVGLAGQLYCQLEYNNEDRRVGLTADFQRFSRGCDETLEQYWEASAPEAHILIRDFVRSQERLLAAEEDEKSGKVANYMVAAGIGQGVGQSVHENITLAALIQAGIVPSGMTYRDVVGYFLSIKEPAIFEFFRGVIWNDDPACQLFKDDKNNNGNFAFGVEWLFNFSMEWLFAKNNIIWRSHYGDLQFLHAMGTQKGEKSEVTKSKIMRWLEVMYKLSVEDGIYPHDPINRYLGDLFPDNGEPKGTDSLRQLLMGSTPSYTDPIISRRALGSCFHLIQDSYALGHCQRDLINPENKLPKADRRSLFKKVSDFFSPVPPILEPDLVLFPKGTPGRFSHLRNFHCYHGQSKDDHSHYDQVMSRADLEPSDLSSFDCLNGARDAIDKCTRLAQFWNNKTKWDAGVREFLEDDVFMMQDATDSDTNVDGHLK